MKSYDIFVSYRRDGGEDKARILNQHLSAVGYNVFFDHEAAISGEFESVILAAVEVAPIFILLLTPGCLDRCVSEKDWVRREIERALELKKKIIPVIPNDNFSFDELNPKIPSAITDLKNLQFADIDYHKHFKSTANEMIEVHIMPVVKPSMVTIDNGNVGAKIHFFSDISCRVLDYGNQIAVTDAEDSITGVIARLLKGRHRLEFKSIEHESDSYKEEISISDNDYEDYFNIFLQPIKDKRMEEERLQKEEENRKAEEERLRVEAEREKAQQSHNNNYKYDLFLCYARQDATIVRRIADILSKSGYNCFIDIEGIQSGAQYDRQIIDAIDQSKCLLYFHSANSNNSQWADKELSYAICKDMTIVPIKLDDTRFSRLELAHLNYFEIRQSEDAMRIVEVLKSMNIVSGKVSSPSSLFSSFFNR